MKFTEVNLSPEVQEGIEAMSFEEMTAVQEQTIPLILESKDLIACAQTGTGKTAAFLLPILSMMRTKNSSSKVRTLIIVPTRELALQIDQQVEGFAYFCPTTSIPIYGGNNSSLWDQQRTAITEGADILVATPGRLLAHMKLGYVDFSGLEYLVLDEADRMLDMGFYEDIAAIVKALPATRQSLMFSATMPPKIRNMAKEFLVHPKEINIAISRPNEAIVQAAYICYDAQKINLLCELLEDSTLQSVVVFTATKQATKNVAHSLSRRKVNAKDIHSDLDQKEREEAIRLFKARKIQVLVATDILSRGIDIEDIDLVVNYDVPNEPEDYIHRIGRTARAKAKGKAFTFVNEKDQSAFKRIEDFLKRIIDKYPIPKSLGDAPEYQPLQRRKYHQKPKHASSRSQQAKESKRHHRRPSGNTPKTAKRKLTVNKKEKGQE